MFRRARQAEPDPWEILAASLGLQPGDAGDLLRILDLDAATLASEVWQVRDAGNLRAYFFSRLDEAWAGAVLRPVGCCLLVPESGLDCPPLRVTRRLRDQQAGFQATATHADVVLTGDGDFDSAYVVVSRDADAACRALSAPVRQVLGRLLSVSQDWPSLAMNERQLLYSAPLPADGSPDELGRALTDVLLLGVALSA